MPHPPIILPEIGRGEEKKIKKTADAFERAAAMIASAKPTTIVLVSPHAEFGQRGFVISGGEGARGNFSRFGAGGVALDVGYDREFAGELAEAARGAGVAADVKTDRHPQLDHAAMIPLLFVNRLYRDYSLVRVGISGAGAKTHFEFGRCIKETAKKLKRNTVFIASGDLSHRLKADGPYGFAAQGPKFDETVVKLLGEGNVMDLLDIPYSLYEPAGECGLRTLWVMAGVLDGDEFSHEVFSYEGTFGVGYSVAALVPVIKDGGTVTESEAAGFEFPARSFSGGRDPYTALARLSLETHLKGEKLTRLPEWVSQEMKTQRGGVFVTLKKRGELRGCIGTITAATENIAQEIISNAVSAGTRDPRFEPVTRGELGEISFGVDVLGRSEPADGPGMLDVKRYGVIVTAGRKRGLLLPNLEGVDSPAQQIEIAKRKAGIGPFEAFDLERFEVVRHE